LLNDVNVVTFVVVLIVINIVNFFVILLDNVTFVVVILKTTEAVVASPGPAALNASMLRGGGWGC